MYAYSNISSIANNAVKLVPLSQMEGQKVLYDNLAGIVSAVEKAENVFMDDLGIAGSMYEIHCMNHEKLYSRQYMS